ncbi:MAG TPA: glycosyltransferase [Syntrophomonadaceae bacterium]|nr:glycosyltransferase [Syntrophomonadaceae bacterium]
MHRILMVTPHIKSQRGNSITAARLYAGLQQYGFIMDLVSFDEPDWRLHLDRCTRAVNYRLVHAFHAFQFSRIADYNSINTIPLLITTTGTDINYDLTGPNKQPTLSVLLKAKKIVYFNQSLAEYSAEIDPRLRSRSVIIPQGIELTPGYPLSRSDLGLSPDNVVFIIPSGLRPIKDLDLAIDALESIYPECPQLRLLIVGAPIDAKYTAHIKYRISTLNWATYLGEVPHRQIRSIMETADIVLNTSRAEGQPQGALEVMSLGKPCILTAVPGNCGIIKHGRHGYYVNTSDELAALALKLIRDPNLQHIMGDAARQLVRERFSAENELSAYSRIYQELLLPPYQSSTLDSTKEIPEK